MIDRKDLSKKLESLSVSDEKDAFFIKKVASMNLEYAKTLVDKHIHFEWRHKEEDSGSSIKESMSGKVLGYDNERIKVYTRYEFMLEEDLKNPNDVKDNAFIKNIPFHEITNIIEFDNHRNEFWEMLPEDYNGKVYEITNWKNRKIIVLIYDFDGINIYFYVKYQDKEKIVTEKETYPLYLLKDIKEV